MTISERIFGLIRERGYTQKEFSKRTGIAESTISDWKKKGTNPVSDKILIICKVLEVSPYFLLSGSEDPVVEKKVSVSKVTVNMPAVKKDKPAGKTEKDPAKEKVQDREAGSQILPEIATVSHDDNDYHIGPADGEDLKKEKKKDKDKDKKKEKNKDKTAESGKEKDKEKKKDKKKDKKKKKKGYLITY